jgi:plastocyanin
MIDYNFTPQRITVEAGSRVSFTNSGIQPHNAAGADAGGGGGDSDTGMLTGGETATVAFNRPGTYTYTCTPHPFMIGQIIVTGEAVAAIVVDSPGQKTPAAPASAEHGTH